MLDGVGIPEIHAVAPVDAPSAGHKWPGPGGGHEWPAHEPGGMNAGVAAGAASPGVAAGAVSTRAVAASGRLAGVDGLRAFAALWVVLFHVQAFTGVKWGHASPVGLVLQSGSTGVSLFLVLSGFCLYMPFAGGRTGRFKSKEFFLRRCRRLMPAYYTALGAATLINVAATAFLSPKNVTHYDFTPLTVPGALWQLVTHATLTQTLFPGTFYGLDGALWSLGLEWQLYLGLPLLVWGVGRFGLARTAAAVVAVNVVYRVALAGAIGHGLIPAGGDLANAVLPNLLPGRWAEFVFGMIAAELYVTGWVARWLGRPAMLLGTGAAALALAFISVWASTWPNRHLLFGAMFFLMLCLVLASNNIVSRVFAWRPLVTVGVMSYSLYLVHQPLVQALSYLLIVHGHATPRWAFLVLLLCIPLLLVVAWVLFLAVERRTLGTHQSPEVAFLTPRALDLAVARAGAAVRGAVARVWRQVPERWSAGVRAPTWAARAWRVRVEYRIAAAAMVLAVAAALLLGPLSALRPTVHAAVHTAGRDLRALAHPGAHGGTPATAQPAAVSSAPATSVELRGTALISAGVPAYASSTYNPAGAANDLSYDTEWRSRGVPSWLAYDLSRVPTAQRSAVLVVWYNGSYEYDNAVVKMDAYNCPRDYTIDVNAAPGGGAAPTTGWVTRVTVTGNTKHSRQHIIDMRGFNWVRIRATAVDGTTYNEDIALNMDVYTAGPAIADGWIFYGDSITAGGMNHNTLAGVPAFTSLIHRAHSARYPVAEDGGEPFLTSADGARLLPGWLALFPGKYVGLSFGTNDALGCVDPQAFYGNYVTMVRAVLAAGKVPVVPHFPWGPSANIQRCGPGLNAEIDQLYRTFPQIVRGPNLWVYFQSHADLISTDGVHPNEQGYGAYRQQWVRAMLAEVER